MALKADQGDRNYQKTLFRFHIIMKSQNDDSTSLLVMANISGNLQISRQDLIARFTTVYVTFITWTVHPAWFLFSVFYKFRATRLKFYPSRNFYWSMIGCVVIGPRQQIRKFIVFGAGFKLVKAA